MCGNIIWLAGVWTAVKPHIARCVGVVGVKYNSFSVAIMVWFKVTNGWGGAWLYKHTCSWLSTSVFVCWWSFGMPSLLAGF